MAAAVVSYALDDETVVRFEIEPTADFGQQVRTRSRVGFERRWPRRSRVRALCWSR